MFLEARFDFLEPPREVVVDDAHLVEALGLLVHQQSEQVADDELVFATELAAGRRVLERHHVW